MTSTSSISTLNPTLPNDVIENVIFPNLSLPELGTCSRVSKVWREMAKKHINAFSHEKAFGPKEWHTYFGAYLRNVPRLPLNIAEIMNSPCPFWSGKKVQKTHVLVLIPETVSGKPLTLKTLAELVKKPLQGFATKYGYFDLGKYTDPAAGPSHWVLLTRDVIKGSRNKSYQKQQTLLTQNDCDVYSVPTICDATVCIFMQFVQSGTQLYCDNPLTYTRCQEKHEDEWQLVVGNFGPSGLHIRSGGSDCERRGMGACRKL